jgi:hypothetical protein
MDPEKMALVDLEKHNESRIAIALGVPPFLVGLPGGGDSMTYSNVSQTFDFHWRMGLRPKAQTVMAALSGWLLPRQTRVELNRDEYVQPARSNGPRPRILNAIVDPPPDSQPSVAEIATLNGSTTRRQPTLGPGTPMTETGGGRAGVWHRTVKTKSFPRKRRRGRDALRRRND